MALAATTIWEVETGGDDTNNGGAFDPGQTAGMFTDGAATSADTASPVFTSASYTFVAGDVNAWVFIGAGTNWLKGWYQIASVAGGAATLVATVGTAVQASGATTSPILPSTTLGVATTASPTGATWSLDYSQQAAARYTYTDLVSAGAGLTVSSVLKPFAKEQVGNSLVITGGTNFTTGRYVIASVAAGVATVLGAANITTGVGANGTGGQGGALLSYGLVGAHNVASNQTFIQTGSYTVASASTNIATGCYTSALSSVTFEGYDTVRGDLTPIAASGTRPTITASGISTFTLINATGGATVRHLILDGGDLTSSRGMTLTAGFAVNVHGVNFTNSLLTGTAEAWRCTATSCLTASPFINTGATMDCLSYSNAISGFQFGMRVNCVAYGNTGASSDGIDLGSTTNGCAVNCTSYGNGRDGIRASGFGQVLINNACEGNTGKPITANSSNQVLIHNGVFGNSGGGIDVSGSVHVIELGTITGSGSFFTDAASGDFSLNTTAGAGAALRAAGYPGLLPLGLTQGYLDVGVAQHADPAGAGGGGIIFIIND